ncbi:MAG: hypothetical protein ACRD0U_04520 [Acidimicrobiales bacterium]
MSLEIPALFTVLTIGADPTRVTWHLGDGGETHCDGRGLEWSPAAEQAGAVHCGYTYQRSSVGRRDLAFEARAEVEWEAWYQVDGGPRSGWGSCRRRPRSRSGWPRPRRSTSLAEPEEVG